MPGMGAIKCGPLLALDPHEDQSAVLPFVNNQKHQEARCYLQVVASAFDILKTTENGPLKMDPFSFSFGT